MKTAETHTTATQHRPEPRSATGPFFQPERTAGFFGGEAAVEPFFSPATVQPKLKIGAPDDAYEREADQVAEQVVQRLAQPTTETGTSESNTDSIQAKPVSAAPANINPLQRQSAPEAEEEELQTQEEEPIRRKAIFDSAGEEEGVQRKCATCAAEEEDMVRRLPASLAFVPRIQRKCAACAAQEEVRPQRVQGVQRQGDGSRSASDEFSRLLHSSKSSGQPLPVATRTSMESAMGADFSRVRVHTGSQAANLSRDIGAQAFTHGSDIYFNQGKYDPGSNDGQRLLAHELTHTVQQGAAGKPKTVQTSIQRWPDWMSDAADWVSDTASGAVDSVVEGAEWVGGKVKDGAEWVGGKVRDGAEWVGGQLSAAARWVIDRIMSVINRGKNYLNEKWEDVKEYGRNSFENIKNGFGKIIHYVTNPLALFTQAMSLMDANFLGSIWSLVTTGATGLWVGINSIINDVLKVGERIWSGITGFISGIFNTIEGLLDSTAFGLLPDWLQNEARSLFNGLRSLWNRVSSFWTDLWQRLQTSIREILTAVRSFVDNVINYGIQAVITLVQDLKEAYDYLARIFENPRAFIQPFLDQIAEKIHAEAPANAKGLTHQFAQQNHPGSAQAAEEGTVQKYSEVAGEERATASLQEVIEGIIFYIARAWSRLDIKEMLWTTVVTMFWPPATIEAIYQEFSSLWNVEWAHTLDSLYTPRNFFDDPLGSLHDIWSNFLILLEFPLALWRAVNRVVGYLMGYITIVIILVEAIVGGVLAVEVGVVPGLLAGAAAGVETAAVLGEALMLSYLAAEGTTVGLAITQLFTARQTCVQRQKDMVTTASSLIGMGVALALQILMALLSALVNLIVQAVRGLGKTVPKAPPAKAPPVEAPPPPGKVIPFPGKKPAPSPPAEAPPIAAKFEPGSGAYPIREALLAEEESTPLLDDDAKDTPTATPEIQTSPLKGAAVAAGGVTAEAVESEIDPDRCEEDEEDCELPFKWTRNNPTVPGNMVLRYCGKGKNTFVKHGHHTWPKFIGGPESQTLMPVEQNIHLREFHGNHGPNGGIHTYIQNYLNNSNDYKDLLQGNDIKRNNTNATGNQLLINRMRTGGGNDATLRRRIRNQLLAYYRYYKASSKPKMPTTAYSVGLGDSVDNIV